jgi:adapter protein MecA 1/2
MRIEKLNENKIRFILNLEDLKEKNIDFHTFMSNSIEAQDLFLDMLEQAEREMGFTTKNYRLSIEVIATSDGNFILTVTRVIPDKDILSPAIKKIKTKRKSITPDKFLSVYSFNSFDEFCEFCTYLSTSHLSRLNKKLKNSSLYLYNSKYYLILYNITLNLKDFKTLHCLIIEFAKYIIESNIFERKLIEYGKEIIGKNAINICTKHFG